MVRFIGSGGSVGTHRSLAVRRPYLGAVLLAGAASEPITDDLFAGKMRGYEAILAGLDIVLPSVILAGAATALAADGSRVPQTAPLGQSSTVTSGSVLVSTGPSEGSEKASFVTLAEQPAVTN